MESPPCACQQVCIHSPPETPGCFCRKEREIQSSWHELLLLVLLPDTAVVVHLVGPALQLVKQLRADQSPSGELLADQHTHCWKSRLGWCSPPSAKNPVGDMRLCLMWDYLDSALFGERGLAKP